MTWRTGLLAWRNIMAKKPFARLIKILTGIYTGAEGEFSRLERFAHFWVLAIRSFARNRCPVHAAALSYATLLALIPLFAVAISVTSSLLKNEGEEQIYRFIDKFVSNVMPPATLSTNGPAVSLNLSPGMSVALTPTNSVTETNSVMTASDNSVNDTRVVTVQKEAARNIHDFVQNTRSGALGITGMALLVFVAISMLNRVEATFNDIWGVTRGRSWLLRIVLYWATITLGPLAIIAALGLAGGS